MFTEPTVLQARAIGLDPGTLGLTIFPTEKCNFRCVYCYEAFPNVRLDDVVTSSILRLIEHRSRDLCTLSIGWFGGEPLLESSRILQIARFAQNTALAHGFAFKSHITTNGYLLNFDLFEDLVEGGVCSFQISLDGTEVEHNKTRRSGNTDGTFATIMDNLLAMRESSKLFDITLRLHVHEVNVGSVIELIDDIAVRFKNDDRFKVNIQRILNYGGARQNPLKLASREVEEFIHKHLLNVLPTSQILDPEDALLCCYASLPNHFVIRANGKIQKCTVALYDERNDVGELLHDGSIKWFGQEKLRAWSAGLFEGDLEKMLCPWKVMQREGVGRKPEKMP